MKISVVKLFFALGVVVMLGIIAMFGFKEVVSSILSVNIYYILLAFGVHLLILAILGVRMQIIARKYDRISYRKSLETVIIGLFVNFLTPLAKIGGEPVKIYLLKKNCGTAKAGAIVTLDTFVEILSSVIFFIAVLVMFFTLIPQGLFPYYAVFIVIGLLMLFIFLKISLSYGLLKRVIDFTVDRLSKFKFLAKRLENARKKDYAALFKSAFSMLLTDKKIMFSTLGVSLLSKFLELLRFYLIFLALNQVLPFSTLALVWGFLLMLFLIPWLPGSLGLIEAGVAYAFITFGVAGPVAMSGILLDRMISFWFIMFLGAALASRKMIGISEILEPKK